MVHFHVTKAKLSRDTFLPSPMELDSARSFEAAALRIGGTDVEFSASSETVNVSSRIKCLDSVIFCYMFKSRVRNFFISENWFIPFGQTNNVALLRDMRTVM